MLKHLTYHFQLKHNLKLFHDSLSPTNAKHLRDPIFKLSLFKISHIYLDHIHPLISQLYNTVGNPAYQCQSRGNPIPNNVELRRYSDQDTNVGRESDKGCYYHGYTSYLLACHAMKRNTAVDLPLQFQLVTSSWHDVITIFSTFT